jgi:hypothetical protein
MLGEVLFYPEGEIEKKESSEYSTNIHRIFHCAILYKLYYYIYALQVETIITKNITYM